MMQEEKTGAVDLSECRWLIGRCKCPPCRVCGLGKHMAVHGPRYGYPPGSRPWGHRYEPPEMAGPR